MKQINKKVMRFFSALADETRLRIITSLAKKPRTVNEIHSYLGRDTITLSAISHQLKDLANHDIVVYIKNGREKQFRLSDNFCWCILRDAYKHFNARTRCKECSKLKW